MFKKVLIANRGEIALRIIRACRELGIATVAVHSQADADALHVRFADEAVCIGPPRAPESYLNMPRIIAAAEITGADAIHPGYGFLSENAEFADICEQCGLTFIGPTPEDMQHWGDKVTRARAAPSASACRCFPARGAARRRRRGRPGQAGRLPGHAQGLGRRRRARHADRAQRGRSAARLPARPAEAMAGFKNGELYLERFVERPRHIEFQVLCDGKGGVLVLGERECSIQRRHQKLLEEAPSSA